MFVSLQASDNQSDYPRQEYPSDEEIGLNGHFAAQPSEHIYFEDEQDEEETEDGLQEDGIAPELVVPPLRPVVPLVVGEKKEVGTIDTVHAQLQQFFIYGALYKKIGLQEFSQEYSGITLEMINKAINESALLLPNALISDITFRYNVVREVPGTVIVDEQEYLDERLYDLASAQVFLRLYVHNYIDEHAKSVRKKCVGPGLHGTPSQDIIQPCQCDLQIHRSCFKHCRNNNIKWCLNSFCEKKVWDTRSYKKGVKSRPLDLTEVYAADCPICFEPFKDTETPVAGAGTSSAVADDDISIERVHKNKKHKKNKS